MFARIWMFRSCSLKISLWPLTIWVRTSFQSFINSWWTVWCQSQMFIQAWLLWMAESHSQTETPKGQIQTIVAQLQHGYFPGSKVTLISTLSDLWKFHIEPKKSWFWQEGSCRTLVLRWRPGDTVWWHCDLIHAVEGVHGGLEDAAESWRSKKHGSSWIRPVQTERFVIFKSHILSKCCFFPLNSDMFNNGFFSCGNSADVRGFPTISHWFLWYAKTLCWIRACIVVHFLTLVSNLRWTNATASDYRAL